MNLFSSLSISSPSTLISPLTLEVGFPALSSSLTNLTTTDTGVKLPLCRRLHRHRQPRSHHRHHRRTDRRATQPRSKPHADNHLRSLRLPGHQRRGGWERCWEEGLTPWDLGRATPVLLDLLQRGLLPEGRALVPGCGSGHDVVAMACPERYVIGLDMSEGAIRKARELSSSLQSAEYFSFLREDFFTWKPTELFDLIFDYTFFCAIEPDMRSAWARRMQDLLKPDGELVTLMFPIDDRIGGPPYKACVADYEEVLHPMGFQAISVVENELAIEPRKGKEKLGRWKRVPGWSAL